MAAPTPVELAIAERIVNDFIFTTEEDVNIEDIREGLTQGFRPFNIAAEFTNNEIAKYEDNLRLLLAAYDDKLMQRHLGGRSWTNVYRGLDELLMDSAGRLRARVGHLAVPAANDHYISQLRHGRGHHSMSWHYEAVWYFISGRGLYSD